MDVENNSIEKINREIQELETQKLRLLNRETKQQKQDKRRAQNKFKYQVGGLLIKQFQIENVEDAERIAIYFAGTVKSNKDKWSQIPLKSREEKQSE